MVRVFILRSAISANETRCADKLLENDEDKLIFNYLSENETLPSTRAAEEDGLHVWFAKLIAAEDADAEVDMDRAKSAPRAAAAASEDDDEHDEDEHEEEEAADHPTAAQKVAQKAPQKAAQEARRTAPQIAPQLPPCTEHYDRVLANAIAWSHKACENGKYSKILNNRFARLYFLTLSRMPAHYRDATDLKMSTIASRQTGTMGVSPYSFASPSCY